MTSANQPKPTGFTETVTAQIGAAVRRQFQAFVPSPLPPSDLDISANAYREYDDNFASLTYLAAASPDRGYAVNRLARAREAAASCNIENIDVTPYDILKATLISTQPALPISQGINCLYAINELCREDLTVKTINASHHTLMTNDPEFPSANIGTFRKSQIFITNNGRIIHCMAPQRRLHQLMADLEEWIHSIHYRESSLFARVALTHYQFETIHPYDDGNGRIGRAINCAIAAKPLSATASSSTPT